MVVDGDAIIAVDVDVMKLKLRYVDCHRLRRRRGGFLHLRPVRRRRRHPTMRGDVLRRLRLVVPLTVNGR